MWTVKTKILYVMYRTFASWLPESRHFGGAKAFRGFFAKRIVNEFGINVNIEKMPILPRICQSEIIQV